MALEKICAWKEIVEKEKRGEGRLKRCYEKCDGYNTNCDCYSPVTNETDKQKVFIIFNI